MMYRYVCPSIYCPPSVRHILLDPASASADSRIPPRPRAFPCFGCLRSMSTDGPTLSSDASSSPRPACPRNTHSLGPAVAHSRPHGCLLEHPSLAYNKSFTSVSFVVTARCLCCHDAGRHSCCPDWAGSWATHSDVSIEFNKAGCWLRSTAEKGPSCKSHRRLLLPFDDPVGSQSRQRHVPLCPRLAGMACCHDTMPPVARLARTLLLLQAVGGLWLPRTSDEHLDTPAALTAPSETVAFAPALILLPPFPTWPLSRSRCIDTKQVAISSKNPLPDSAVLSKSRCLGCRA